jgi:hypothetical protein
MLNNFILLDAARLEGELENAKTLNASYHKLYNTKSEIDVADVFPYLFYFQLDSDFSNWYLNTGWGKSWGIIIQSEYLMEETCSHFRKFLLVKTEPDKEFFFRFYDPRVLCIFLPTCNVNQLREFFGPVEKFICEDEDADYGLVYSFDNNKLKTNRIKRAEIFDQFEKSTEAKKYFI